MYDDIWKHLRTVQAVDLGKGAVALAVVFAVCVPVGKLVFEIDPETVADGPFMGLTFHQIQIVILELIQRASKAALDVLP